MDKVILGWNPVSTSCLMWPFKSQVLCASVPFPVLFQKRVNDSHNTSYIVWACTPPLLGKYKNVNGINPVKFIWAF